MVRVPKIGVLLFALMFVLIVAACTSGDDSGDGADDATSSQSDSGVSIASGYPRELVPPGGELESSTEELELGGLRTEAVFRVTAETAGILDFYELAFSALEPGLTAERQELGAAGSLLYGDDGTLASVRVGADGATRIVTVSYLIRSSTVSEADAPAPADEEPAEADEAPAETDDEAAESPLVTVSASDLLLSPDDLPDAEWLAVLSPSLIIEFSEATGILFNTSACRDLDETVNDDVLLGTNAVDLDTRSFRTGGGFTFARIIQGVSVFASEEEAEAAFETAGTAVTSGVLETCFESGVAEAEAAAAADGIPLTTYLGPASLALANSESLQGSAAGGPAGFFVTVDLQLHRFQRGNVVGVIATVISGMPDLVDQIPQILCTFESRILGSSPGDCELTAGSNGSVASSDGGAADVGSGAAGGGSTGGDTGGNDVDEEADPGARIALAAIPPVLIYPSGAGGWTAQSVAEGTKFTSSFNVPEGSVDEILNYYQNAFASLGAPTVTAREVTPASATLSAQGAGGRGVIFVIGTPQTTKAVQAEFVQFE